ncbi:hypothetical protein ABZ783_30395 [Micromonospora sp. NPDC047738]|uniref:hypothetical protein n=1 Tax=Micromonospora sp. NPDC047738 TaxID=3155741 RepID=UPI0033C9C535
MEAVRRFLRTPASSAIGMLAAAVAFGGATVGLFMLAEHVRDSGLFGRLLAVIGFYLAGAGALIVTLLLLMAVLGPNLTTKLFIVPNKMLTPQAVRDLTAKEAAPATVPIAPRQGVLRVIPVKPEWWLDEDASTDDAAPVVAVADVEYRLPGWDPYDVAVPAGAVDVVAWVPRRDGSPGRRVRNSIPVPEGRVGALVFRPSSLPELPGTVESLDSELTGNPSMFRLALAAAALIGTAYAAWQLAAR